MPTPENQPTTPQSKNSDTRSFTAPIREKLKKGVDPNQIIKETVDPLNEKMKERYEGVIPGAELNGTINKFQSDKLIEHYDKYGTFDGALPNGIVPKIESATLGTVSDTENTLTDYLNDYSGVIAIVALGIGLVWLKAADVHLKVYELVAGEDGLYRKFLEKIGQGKESVSDSNLFLYNKALKEVEGLARAALRIDNEKFGQREFLLFAKIQFCLSNNIGEYDGLQGNIDLLQAALQAQSSYITIHQIELSSQGSKQQEFYHYTYIQLQEDPDAQYLRVNIQNKLAEVLPQVKTEEGRTTLEVYTKAISELAASPFALKLLVKFKALHLDDFSNLRRISELINSLNGKEVEDLKTVTYLVMANYDDFEAIAEIIGLTEKQRSPDTFARMIQYIALIYRYQDSFNKFQQLIQVMRQWYKPYRIIQQIRKEHPPETHWQPKDFERQIPGLSLYSKYKDSLTDQKTGYSYIDFGEELENATTQEQGLTLKQ